MASPTPALVDDLVEEVLLRLPPDDPAQLLRAGLVCKRWRRIVSDAGFGRRFRSFHRRSPPMLGFFCRSDGVGPSRIRFVPTSASCPPIADHRGCRVLDARQGRVLLLARPPVRECKLAVWDPIAGERRGLPTLPRSAGTYNASVLCAGGGACCGRHSCHCKQFLVVFVATDDSAGIFACVYSSEYGAWSEPTSVQAQRPPCRIDPVPGALAGNAIYFLIQLSSKILKYDLGTKAFSVIHLPPSLYIGDYYNYVAPMATKDGGLGFVGVEDTRLHLWSWKADRNGQARWVESRTIRLKKRIPVDPDRLFLIPDFVGIADGTRVFLVATTDGIFSIDLKTLKVRKVYEGFETNNIVPFLSFYTPDREEREESSQASVIDAFARGAPGVALAPDAGVDPGAGTPSASRAPATGGSASHLPGPGDCSW